MIAGSRKGLFVCLFSSRSESKKEEFEDVEERDANVEELRVKRMRGTEGQQALSGRRFLFSQTEDKDKERYGQLRSVGRKKS